jgi:FlaA1/EpsC-like NDP-sugar epimerase
MGKPVKIYDLAKRMIELSGLRVKSKSFPRGDIEIKITGLRPGEKLYEELLITDDPRKTNHRSIFMAYENFLPWSELQCELDNLVTALSNYDIEETRSLMQKLVKDYQPDDKSKSSSKGVGGTEGKGLEFS